MPSKNSTVSRRKPVSRRTSSRKKKQTVSRPMPVWLRNLLAFCIIKLLDIKTKIILCNEETMLHWLSTVGIFLLVLKKLERSQKYSCNT